MIALAALALAMADECRLPAQVPAPAVATPDGPTREIPIASLILSLTWTGGFCADHGTEPDARSSCDGHAGRGGFVLHGLWPDGAPVDGKPTWPQWCTGKSWQVPAAVVRTMACTTPSADLVAHEWAKHGTCMAPDPAAYFAQSRHLWQQVRLPDMAALAARAALTAGDIRRAFAAANPRYSVRSIDLLLHGGRLEEVHLCHDAKARPAPCRLPGPADGQPVRIEPAPGKATR